MARQIIYTGNVFPEQTVATTLSQTIDLKGLGDSFSFQVNYADATTTLRTFTTVNTTTDTATITEHGQKLGSRGQLTTDGSLPSGLSTSTDYYLIIVDANTVKFATSLVNAVAGTAVNITSSGSGTQTFTPSTLAGGLIRMRMSADGLFFTDVTRLNLTTSAPRITPETAVTSAKTWDIGEPSARYINVLYTPSNGTVTFSVNMTSFANQ